MDDYAPSKPRSDSDDWRKESDYHTLMLAAKVLVDKVRVKGALEYMRKCKASDKALERMLVAHKKNSR